MIWRERHYHRLFKRHYPPPPTMEVCLLAGQHLLILGLRAHDAAHERGTLLETADPTRESAPGGSSATKDRRERSPAAVLLRFATTDVEVVVLASDQILDCRGPQVALWERRADDRAAVGRELVEGLIGGGDT